MSDETTWGQKVPGLDIIVGPLPAAGLAGQYVGFDAKGCAFILRYAPGQVSGNPIWVGIGLDPKSIEDHRTKGFALSPLAFTLPNERVNIVAYAKLPDSELDE